MNIRVIGSDIRGEYLGETRDGTAIGVKTALPNNPYIWAKCKGCERLHWRRSDKVDNTFTSKVYCPKCSYKGRPVAGRTISNSGYATIPIPIDNPYYPGLSRLPEHTWVMANILGRKLIKNESVHHKNGIKDDNRAENLELWTGPIRHGQRLDDIIIDYLTRIEDDELNLILLKVKSGRSSPL